MRFDAIGTGWQIDTAEPISQGLATRIHARIDEFDRTYSRFRDDSLVSTIARSPGTFGFPDDAAALFDTYRRLYAATDGRMSPLVGRAMDDLGYDRTYSLRPTGRVRAAPNWDEAFAWDGRALTTLRPVSIDVGAVGKGYLVDLVLELLAEAGHTEAIVDASGDIRHRGAEPIRVALEHPRDPSKAIGIANIGNGSICASASNRRAWGDGLHHVVDATTGLPTREVIATWAITPLALEADGLATALFFTDPERLEAEFSFDWVRMLTDGRVERSTGLDGEIFT
ncbi:thiamine biosynthesis lipoprotein [Salinibacterium sp. CAN_S4]|uniref:FAD:protein FMN transferase n=1 Tax=Salinibacterium sp. CAN_S4 TaxID=2787727 RepID=UPI0018F001ED